MSIVVCRRQLVLSFDTVCKGWIEATVGRPKESNFTWNHIVTRDGFVVPVKAFACDNVDPRGKRWLGKCALTERLLSAVLMRGIRFVACF